MYFNNNNNNSLNINGDSNGYQPVTEYIIKKAEWTIQCVDIVLDVVCPICKKVLQTKACGGYRELIRFSGIQVVCNCGLTFFPHFEDKTGGDYIKERISQEKDKQEERESRKLNSWIAITTGHGKVDHYDPIDTEVMECLSEDQRKGRKGGGSKCKTRKKKPKFDRFYWFGT